MLQFRHLFYAQFDRRRTKKRRMRRAYTRKKRKELNHAQQTQNLFQFENLIKISHPATRHFASQNFAILPHFPLFLAHRFIYAKHTHIYMKIDSFLFWSGYASFCASVSRFYSIAISLLFPIFIFTAFFSLFVCLIYFFLNYYSFYLPSG